MMYSNEDLELFYFRYQTEALPHGTSLQTFCLNNNVPYNIFSKWYKDTSRKVIEVQVQGRTNQKELSGEDGQGEKIVRKTASGSDVACNKVLPTNTSELSEVRFRKFYRRNTLENYMTLVVGLGKKNNM